MKKKKIKKIFKNENVQFWLKKTLKAIAFGSYIFLLLNYLFASAHLSIFFGVYAAWLWLGAIVFENIRSEKAINFCEKNLIIAIIMIALGFCGLFFYTPITLPLFIAGVILFCISLYSGIGASLFNYFLDD